MDFTIPIFQELNDQLVGGVITPNDCLKVLNKIQFERLDLRDKCEALMLKSRLEQATKRTEMYKANPEWFEMRGKLHQAWRDARPLTNKNVITEINYLKDEDLLNIDKVKLANLNLDGITDVTLIYKSLEELILIKNV